MCLPVPFARPALVPGLLGRLRVCAPDAFAGRAVVAHAPGGARDRRPPRTARRRTLGEPRRRERDGGDGDETGGEGRAEVLHGTQDTRPHRRGQRAGPAQRAQAVRNSSVRVAEPGSVDTTCAAKSVAPASARRVSSAPRTSSSPKIATSAGSLTPSRSNIAR